MSHFLKSRQSPANSLWWSLSPHWEPLAQALFQRAVVETGRLEKGQEWILVKSSEKPPDPSKPLVTSRAAVSQVSKTDYLKKSCFSNETIKFHEDRNDNCLPSTEHLAHSRCSIKICRMPGWMSRSPKYPSLYSTCSLSLAFSSPCPDGLFFSFWLHKVFNAAHRLSLVMGSESYCPLWASYCGGSSCCGSWALERRLCSCGRRA